MISMWIDLVLMEAKWIELIESFALRDFMLSTCLYASYERYYCYCHVHVHVCLHMCGHVCQARPVHKSRTKS